MTPASTIRQLRESLGLSHDDLARRLGVSLESVGDLESYDDEVTTAISLRQALVLAESLQVTLLDLLNTEGDAEPTIPASQASAALAQLIQQQERSRQSIEDDIGWEMTDFYTDPARTLLERPMTFAQELGRVLGIDWKRLLPRTHAA